MSQQLEDIEQRLRRLVGELAKLEAETQHDWLNVLNVNVPGLDLHQSLRDISKELGHVVEDLESERIWRIASGKDVQ